MCFLLHKQKNRTKRKDNYVALFVVKASAVNRIAKECDNLYDNPKSAGLGRLKVNHTAYRIYRNKSTVAEIRIRDFLCPLHSPFTKGKEKSQSRRYTERYPKDKAYNVRCGIPKASVTGIQNFNELLIFGGQGIYRTPRDSRAYKFAEVVA